MPGICKIVLLADMKIQLYFKSSVLLVFCSLICACHVTEPSAQGQTDDPGDDIEDVLNSPHPRIWITQKERPGLLEKSLELAAQLSKPFPFVRVDFYICENKLVFGELTFFHWSGMVPFEPIEWDYKLGEWIHLPAK